MINFLFGSIFGIGITVISGLVYVIHNAAKYDKRPTHNRRIIINYEYGK